MIIFNSPIIITMLFSGVICLIVAVGLFLDRNKTPDRVPFILLLLGIVYWITASILGFTSTTSSEKLLTAKIEYLGVVSVPFLVFVSVMYRSHLQSWFTLRRLVLMLLVPLISLSLVWTNDLHGLIWASFQPYAQNGLMLSAKVYGAWFWVMWAYIYALLLASTIILIRMILKSGKAFQWQTATLVIAILAPWIGNLIYVLHLNPLGDIDLTPLSFAVTGVMLALGILRLKLFDILPVAHDVIVENIPDGLIILDKKTG